MFIFTAVFIYYLINDIEANKIDVIFTVIVGWLGLIIGAFFGEKFMEGLTKEEKSKGINLLDTIEDYEEQIDGLLEIINNYEELLK